MKRGPQIIPLKDVGFIIAETAVNRDSVVLDAGAGSGGLSLFLANMVKKVYTMDIREDHLTIVKKNIEMLGLTNVKATLASVYEDKLPANIDLVTLDTPEPWLALSNVNSVLKPGGFIVSYSPCTPQISDFVEAVEAMDDLVYLKTVELIEREWDFQGRKVRPKSQQRINHSGFLTFVRKVKK
jgi:tRNA (adenine57-N1/adenine58-N1)-methyltransferase